MIFVIPDATGDTRSDFDVANPEQHAAAMAMFNELTKNRGFRAASLGEAGEPGKIIKDFDKSAEKVLFFRSLQGG